MIVGTLGILLGTAVAISAGRFPTQRVSLERWGGMLMVGGIALVAFAFPFV
jgi:hypothetical protein